MDSPRLSIDRFLRHYLLAVQCATRVPVKGALAGWIGFTPDMLRASAPHLPGAGWLVGMAGCVAFAVLSIVMPDVPATPFAAAVGCIAATTALTGALHEEALGRFCAGLRSGMQVTWLPVVVLALVVLMKVALLAVLAARSPGAVLTALLGAHAVSRFWPLLLSQDKPARSVLAMAAAWCVVPLALMGLAHHVSFPVAAVIVSGLVAFALRWWLRKLARLDDADALGGAQQLFEVAFYLGATLGVGNR